MWTLALVLLFSICSGNAEECAARPGSTSIICVCNSTYCDTLPQVGNLSRGSYELFRSTLSGLRLARETGSFSTGFNLNLSSVTVDRSETHQTILGFGGAFTDSAGINIALLPEAAQEKLLRAYFSTDGAEYNLGRVPVGGSDFSPRGYTYADDSEGSLDGFSLQAEDYNYKIPYIRRASELSPDSLKLLASAWSPPAWMKTIEDLTAANSFLKDEYYQLWADYYIRFFEEYAKNNVTFWALTTQNEPSTGYIGIINTLAWTVQQLIQWLTSNLGPTIKGSEFSYLDILLHDDQTVNVPLVQEYYNDPAALNYTDGVAVHFGVTSILAPLALEAAKTDKKDVYVLQTQSYPGYTEVPNVVPPVILGLWRRAANYAREMLYFLNFDSVGWIDWNLVLDLEGGPTWVNNYLDAPIIVNAAAGEFYKQPTYYAMAHFSKYIPRGSVRVGTSESLTTIDIQSVAFRRPDGAITVVLHNKGIYDQTVAVYDSEVDGFVSVFLPIEGIATLVYP